MNKTKAYLVIIDDDGNMKNTRINRHNEGFVIEAIKSIIKDNGSKLEMYTEYKGDKISVRTHTFTAVTENAIANIIATMKYGEFKESSLYDTILNYTGKLCYQLDRAFVR